MRFLIFLFSVVLLSGCLSLPKSRLSPPDRNTLVRDQLVIHSDFALAAHHRVFEELTAQRTDLCRRLALSPSDEPIHVYLFQNAERFDDFIRLHYPKFPDRRAFFVETDAQLTIYAQWGDRMSEDLRHETTHGYLHSIVSNIPLWLDEGLAEFYEVPRGRQGLNRPHLTRLLVRLDREHWQPDLPRLEQLRSAADMTQDDYAEAWAWVHFLLQSDPKSLGLLRGYLADLRRDGDTTPISSRMAAFLGDGNSLLTQHLHLASDQQTTHKN
ncbi:MAG: DUF1570 domain-containing protein [Planctomycetaceae bacterium]|nr:DUF1570 domain-containing protein [Planctomycetaceae bacterium]